jgi:hypothetical protein
MSGLETMDMIPGWIRRRLGPVWKGDSIPEM